MEEQPDKTIVDLEETPVAIDVDSLGHHDAVLTAVANRYEQLGHETQQLWVGDLGEGVSAMFDLFIEDLKLLVEVETNDTMIGIDPTRYAPWREAGFRIIVVAPKERLAQVERREGESVDAVVDWSLDGHKVILGDLIEK